MRVIALRIEPPPGGPDQNLIDVQVNSSSPVVVTQSGGARPGDLIRFVCTLDGEPATFRILKSADGPFPFHPQMLEEAAGPFMHESPFFQVRYLGIAAVRAAFHIVIEGAGRTVEGEGSVLVAPPVPLEVSG